MTKKSSLFNVTLEATGARIDKILPSSSAYAKADQDKTLRHRDAIERFNEKDAAATGLIGTHSFHRLDTARSFAMLYMEKLQQGVEDNIDQILAYDGKSKSSSE